MRGRVYRSQILNSTAEISSGSLSPQPVLSALPLLSFDLGGLCSLTLRFGLGCFKSTAWNKYPQHPPVTTIIHSGSSLFRAGSELGPRALVHLNLLNLQSNGHEILFALPGLEML